MKNQSNQLIENTKIIEYLYYLNYTEPLKELCDLEMKAIFGFIPEDKWFTSKRYIHPSRSLFIKGCLAITFEEDNLEDLIKAIEEKELYYDGYKIIYLKSGDGIPYQERLEALRRVGFAIEGDFALQNPSIEFGVTKVNQKWLFGQYLDHDATWVERRQKPYNYSYALDQTIAKTLINIAIGDNFDLKVVDPCCGIGTVLIEGRTIGVDITGFDINPNVVYKCNQNLRYFGFEGDVKQNNILEIECFYDVAIIDLPYGKFSTTSLDEQTIIINQAKNIASKVIFVSMDDMNSLYTSCGYTILETCTIQKRHKFGRTITVCY